MQPYLESLPDHIDGAPPTDHLTLSEPPGRPFAREGLSSPRLGEMSSLGWV